MSPTRHAPRIPVNLADVRNAAHHTVTYSMMMIKTAGTLRNDLVNWLHAQQGAASAQQMEYVVAVLALLDDGLEVGAARAFSEVAPAPLVAQYEG